MAFLVNTLMPGGVDNIFFFFFFFFFFFKKKKKKKKKKKIFTFAFFLFVTGISQRNYPTKFKEIY